MFNFFKNFKNYIILNIKIVFFSFILIIIYNFFFFFDLKSMLFWIFNLCLIYLCLYFYNIFLKFLLFKLYKFYFIFNVFYYKIKFNLRGLIKHLNYIKDFSKFLIKDFFLFFYFFIRKIIVLKDLNILKLINIKLNNFFLFKTNDFISSEFQDFLLYL